MSLNGAESPCRDSFAGRPCNGRLAIPTADDAMRTPLSNLLATVIGEDPEQDADGNGSHLPEKTTTGSSSLLDVIRQNGPPA